MKNLEYALQVLSRVRAKVVFTIYGIQEVPEYWATCEAIAADLPANIEVTYAGELTPETAQDALSDHDLFLLPTRGENYGHVIHEALSAGLPVLLSDQTPWGDVESRGIGWCLSLDDSLGFTKVIEKVAEWTCEQRVAVRAKAAFYAAERANDPETVAANRSLFSAVDYA